jgi:DNA-binding GntR family transcriptional regulator
LNITAGPFERTLFTKEIISKLRMDIILGNLAADTRLLETQLSAQLGVSRGPIRVALQMLEQEGLVKSLPNGGTVVVGLSNKDAEDMFDFRLMMEYRALELVLENPLVSYRPLVDITEQIRETNHKISVEDLTQSVSALDIQFHRSIMIMAENRSMLRAWDTMASILYAMVIISNTTYDSFFAFYKKHKELSDKIIQRNPKCLQEIQDHILNAKKLIIERFNKQKKMLLNTEENKSF